MAGRSRTWSFERVFERGPSTGWSGCGRHGRPGRLVGDREGQPKHPRRAERRPGARRLREAVGDRIDRRRVVSEAEVAGDDGDVLGSGTGIVETRLPGDDAVQPGVDGGGR